jgi:predicted MFS family arabinose efflux permease
MRTISLEKTIPLKTIFWKQIYLLLGLETAVAVGWFAYEQYQPVLLTRFSFQGFAGLLLVLQGLLGAVFHPLSGSLADRIFHRWQSKFPVIFGGILFATLIFMLVGVTLLFTLDDRTRWLIPGLVILWLAAMSTFHSPALSLVESFVPPHRLPFISALLVMAFGLVYAIGPLLVKVLDVLGLAATFALGGILLFITGFSLRYATQKEMIHVSQSALPEPVERLGPAWFSLTGFGVGLAKGSVLFALPVWLAPQLHLDKKLIEALVMGGAVLWALPVSVWIQKIGEQRALLAGTGLAVLSTVLILSVRTVIFGYFSVLMAGFTYSLLATAALPFVLRRSAHRDSGSAVGLFYGGIAAAAASIALLIL